MPILDHLHLPWSGQRTWQAFHQAWAASIARHLNRSVLLEGYVAAPNVQFGPRIEMDVGAFEAATAPPLPGTLTTRPAVVPAPTATIATHFPDTVEVVIVQQEGGPQLVAALELVSLSARWRWRQPGPAQIRPPLPDVAPLVRLGDTWNVLR